MSPHTLKNVGFEMYVDPKKDLVYGRNDMKKKLVSILTIAVMLIASFAVMPNVDAADAASKAPPAKGKWKKLLNKYRNNRNVKQLVFVRYDGRNNTTLTLYQKGKDRKWYQKLHCKAYVGQNGINKKREGDRRTPTGTFSLEKPFGILKDPGSKMKYTKVNRYLYWCGDRKHYNRMVDVRKHPHRCNGEHLINYTRQYAYSMNIGYNKKGTYKKGSAIFLHCFGYNNYTLGCVAVSKANMKTLIRKCGKGTKICIYKK